MSLFADDSKIVRVIKSLEDCLVLQTDLESVDRWCHKWGMLLNAGKCQCMSFTRKVNPTVFYYNVHGNVIGKVNEIRDLGVLVSNDLTFTSHINGIVSKANQTWATVRRVFDRKPNPRLMRPLFESLVRSKLEYNTVSWYHFTKENLEKIERVQRRATRHMVGDQLDYKNRLVTLKMLPLSYRREMSDLNFMYKCTNGGIDLDVSKYVIFRERRGDPMVMQSLSFCRTETFCRSYFNRVHSYWNALPVGTRCAGSLQTFKRSVANFYADLLSERFDPVNACTWVGHCRCTSCRH